MTVQATLEASMTSLDVFFHSRCQDEDRYIPQTQSSAQSVSKLCCSLIPLPRTLDCARKGYYDLCGWWAVSSMCIFWIKLIQAQREKTSSSSSLVEFNTVFTLHCLWCLSKITCPLTKIIFFFWLISFIAFCLFFLIKITIINRVTVQVSFLRSLNSYSFHKRKTETKVAGTGARTVWEWLWLTLSDISEEVS